MLRLLSTTKLNQPLFARFTEYSINLDVLYYAWKLLPGITQKSKPLNDIYIQNYLDLIGSISITAEIQESQQYLCTSEKKPFDYPTVRKCLNKSWNCAILWEFSEVSHKQILILLLEKILPHLEKPVLLTDFLMDSLDVGK